MVSPHSNSDRPRRVIAATLVVVAVISAFGVAYLLSNVLFLLFVGVVLATALEPMIEALQRRRIPQPFAVGAVYACLILLLAVAIIVVSPYVIHQVRGLLSVVPPRTNRHTNGWPTPGTPFGRRLPGGSWQSTRRTGPRGSWSRRLRPSARRPRTWRWQPAGSWWPAGRAAGLLLVAAGRPNHPLAVAVAAGHQSRRGARHDRRDRREGRCLPSRSRPGLPGHGRHGRGRIWPA